MFYCYILKSEKSGAYYVGYTKDLEQRLLMHNNGRVKATKNRGPWQVFYYEEFLNEDDAIHRERQVKGWKSRKAIERLKFLINRGSAILSKTKI